MQRVSPEVAEKVVVLFQNDDGDPRTRQEQTQHHACRSAARNAALHREGFYPHDTLRLEGRKANERTGYALLKHCTSSPLSLPDFFHAHTEQAY